MSRHFASRSLLSLLTLVALLMLPTAPAFGQRVAPEVLDVVPPSPIINLDTVATGPYGTVILYWIAPGDDGNAGQATGYDVRYAASPIDEESWSSASQVTGEPSPSEPYSVQSMTVDDLNGGEICYFAIKTFDEAGNASPISNVASILASAGKNTVFLPLVREPLPPTPPVIPDTTEPLTGATTEHLESVSDTGALTFSQSTPELTRVDVGDVVVAAPSDAAPEGLLRKVTSVTNVGGEIVVQTEPATLEDAIESGSAHLSMPLTPSGVRSATYARGVSPVTSPDGLKFQFSVKDVVLYDKDLDRDTKNDQISADGSLALDLSADFGLDMRLFTVQKILFAVTADEEASLGVKWGVSKEFCEDCDVPIAKYTFSPVTLWVGPVPVVFTPEMEVNLSLEGEVGVSISAGLSQKAHLRVGCIYENGGWSPIYEYNTSFEFTPPKPEFSAWVELSIGPDISFKLYGLVGPYVKPKAYGRAQATLAIEGLDVGLYGGLKVGVGAKFEALGKDIADWEAIEFKVEWPLAEWRLLGNHPPDKASGPRPLDDAVDRPRDTFLSWTGSDPDDGDTLTYDVYLEADVPYPSVKVASDFAGTTFAPEGLLEPNTYYYWRLVARDGSDETTAGPIWSFRTGTSFNSAPFEPSSPTPAHGSGNQPWDVELRWTGGDPDGDAVVYNVYSDISPGPQLGPSQLAHLCVDISEPVCRFQYWAGTRPEMTWMVTARDAHGAEISGPPWTLAFGSNSNHAPNIPSLGGEDGPADGATGLLSHFWLSWTGGDVDDDVVTYDVYMEKDDPTPDLVVCSGPYERCYPGRVDGNATYYWQAQARDEHDAVRLGPVWSFTTRDMVFVAGGPFQMGCDQTNPSARCTRSDELPLHTAQLYDYNIDRVEVTNAQYARCVAANYCEPPKRLDSYTRTSYYDNPAYADFPVVWVDWERARRYCEWAGLRLPTEAEWEKAARGASDTRAYPWGDQEITCDLANYWDVDRGPCVGDTVPATWYPLGASLYGALNMVGNVGEWVNDWYADWYYVESPRDNPQGPSWGQFRVIRGGSWESPYSLTGAHTVYSRSGGDYPANGDFSFGFRCAVTDGW